MAGSDFLYFPGAAPGTTGVNVTLMTSYALPAPKSSYWYGAMSTDETGAAYAGVTNGVLDSAGGPNTLPWYNHAKFGFYSFPDSFSAGRSVFFINEGNTIFKRNTNGPVKAAASTPPQTVGAFALSGSSVALVGAQTAEFWPTDTVLRIEYNKID